MSKISKQLVSAFLGLLLSQTVMAEVRPDEFRVAENKKILAISYESEETDDLFINIYALADGKQLQTLKGFEDGIMDLALSDDGTRLVAVDFEDTVTLWDVNTGKTLAKREMDDIDRVFFNPEGVVAMDERGPLTQLDNALKVIKHVSGRDLKKLIKANEGDIAKTLVSLPLVDLPFTEFNNSMYRKGNDFLYVNDNTVYVMDIERKKQQGKFNVKNEDLAPSSVEGEVWAYNNYDGQEIEIWDYKTQTLKGKINIADIGKSVTDIRFSPTLAALAVQIDDNHSKVVLIDLKTYNLQGELKPEGFVAGVRFLSADRLYLGLEEPEVWDINSKKVLFKIKAPQ